MIELHNIDCMDYMRALPDKAFELAIVDPPYGIGAASVHAGKGGGNYKHTEYKLKDWDNSTMNALYYKELKRVSNNQIIWGANHFAGSFDSSSSGWIVWDKMDMENDYSACELAYTSFNRGLKKFKFLWSGYWDGDRILDTHLGSGSSAIAAHNLGFSFVGCELDADYFEAASQRLEQHRRQLRMFMA
jgi:site-specific DNA-methyltransferase (adenine-specific)